MMRATFLLLFAALPAIGAPPPLPVVKSVSFGAMRTLGGGGTVGGQEAKGTIELSAPAPCVVHCGTYVNGRPSGGMFVHITSNNAVAAVQPSTGMILVPVGQIQQTFTVLTSGVANPTVVQFSAWREGSPAQTTTLTVLPPSLTSFTLDQSTVVGGAPAHGRLTFNGIPASAGAVMVMLSSSNPAAVQVPASVALDVNTTVATFDVKTSGVASNTPVTITATLRDRRDNAALTVNASVLTKMDVSFTGMLTAELNGLAPVSGAVINLSSSEPSHISVPASLTIPAGSSTGGLNITKQPDFSNHNVTISATYNGVTRRADFYLRAKIKADLAVKTVTLQDRFGNAIDHPQDSQSYKMCVTIELLGGHQPDTYYLYPQSTVLHVSHLSPSGTGTSVGREFDVPVNFPVTSILGGSVSYSSPPVTVSYDGSAMWFDPTCIDMPGLPQPGAYVDVTLVVDSKNQTDESNEGNNTHKLRITRQ